MKRSELETARLDTTRSDKFMKMIRPKVPRNDDSNFVIFKRYIHSYTVYRHPPI